MEQSPEGDGVVLCYVVHFLHPTADLSQQIWGGEQMVEQMDLITSKLI